MQSRRYTFAASNRGAPLIDARYQFVFAGGVTIQLMVTGRRVVVFGVRPDWSQGMTERLEWLTELLTAHDGTEQRIRLRKLPRRLFEYTFLIEGQDVRLLEHWLFAWGARVYCLPVWTDITVLTETLLVGSNTIMVADTDTSDYHPGGLAVLWRSNRQHEAVEIASIIGNTLTLTLPLNNTWPAGTRVYPARLVRLEGEAAVTRPTDTLATGRCRFTVEDLDSPTITAAGITYRGCRVWDQSPNRSTDLEETWRRKLAVIDYQTGLPTVDDESASPLIGRTLTWLLTNRQHVTAFRQWLIEQAGRANPFWLPTFATDLVVNRPIAATAEGVIVFNVGYARFIAADPLRRDIVLRTTAGTFYRRITGANEIDEQEELLSLESPLGITLQPAQCLQISYLELTRLDQDAVELHWETDTTANIQLTTRTLPA